MVTALRGRFRPSLASPRPFAARCARFEGDEVRRSAWRKRRFRDPSDQFATCGLAASIALADQ
jgi:hypothetical protein